MVIKFVCLQLFVIHIKYKAKMVQASSSGAKNISKLNKLERINWFIAKKHPALLPQRITSLTLFSSATSELVTVIWALTYTYHYRSNIHMSLSNERNKR